MASAAQPDHTGSVTASAACGGGEENVGNAEAEQDSAARPAEAAQSAERTSEEALRPPIQAPEGQQQGDAAAASTPGLDMELDADSQTQTQALASLKELCDSGLLPVNLYQENVAAIHRSSRRLQQWRERLHEKSQQLLEHHAAMKVRHLFSDLSPVISVTTACFVDHLQSTQCPSSAGARGWDAGVHGRNARGCRSRKAAGPATDEWPAQGNRRQGAGMVPRVSSLRVQVVLMYGHVALNRRSWMTYKTSGTNSHETWKGTFSAKHYGPA